MNVSGALRGALMGDAGTPLWARAACAALVPSGWAYGLAMQARRRAYESGRCSRESVPVPVVSVGNLTLGGTGKTPTASWVLSCLLQRGWRPALVSRGYGGELTEASVVGDGRGAVAACPPAGDEAVMLALKHPAVPVVTGRWRAEAARMALSLGADVIVLDDGFQHLALRRDFDLVLLDRERPFGNGRVFPAGALREPRGALSRADALLLTGEGASARERREVAAAFPGAQVFHGRLVPEDVVSPGGAAAMAPRDLAGAAVVALSGLGRPEGFGRTLSALGARVVHHLAFPDHARYGPSEAKRAAAALDETGADLLVTTEKDAVKLAPFLADERLRVLRVRMEIEGEKELARRILDKIAPAAG